ncbi:uncharacterized protein LOC115713666 isoform X1 [Cannabis sativa]|uniref:uncharacterized protein LOC115713666 isoform X1 n=1 Tax=Cannabis sativa TaxID=3483 RepID=UPI0029C9D98E|nr:uncharacterized protein LOC115713666 isoform X1 [Cannabis sativa]XP_060967925.1 uncharacterized protein LOC115713666 isoform X1 [Cannabis sativa]
MAEMFDTNMYKKDEGPIIVIVTSTTIKKFQGEISFSSTSATKLYINLEIDYVASLIERFSTVVNGVQYIESSNVNKVSLEEEMFVNRMNIKELLEADWDDGMQEYKVTIKAKIFGIDTTFGWYYMSCKTCLKKLVLKNGVHTCDRCDKICDYPLLMYKIHIKVRDKSAETTFVLFNLVAEKLLDTSVKKILPTNNDEVPAVIQALCGKDFVYKLRLNHFNLKDGYENFTVSKIFVPDDILEQAHESKKREEINIDRNENNSDRDLEDLEVEDMTVAGECRKRKFQIVDDEEEVDDDAKN